MNIKVALAIVVSFCANQLLLPAQTPSSIARDETPIQVERNDDSKRVELIERSERREQMDRRVDKTDRDRIDRNKDNKGDFERRSNGQDLQFHRRKRTDQITRTNPKKNWWIKKHDHIIKKKSPNSHDTIERKDEIIKTSPNHDGMEKQGRIERN